MASNKSNGSTTTKDGEAATLQDGIRALGDYAHVDVLSRGGHLVISPDGEPVARLTPTSAPGLYGLSFRNHSGRWEPMPFVGDLQQQAQNVVAALAPYLERWI